MPNFTTDDIKKVENYLKYLQDKLINPSVNEPANVPKLNDLVEIIQYSILNQKSENKDIKAIFNKYKALMHDYFSSFDNSKIYSSNRYVFTQIGFLSALVSANIDVQVELNRLFPKTASNTQDILANQTDTLSERAHKLGLDVVSSSAKKTSFFSGLVTALRNWWNSWSILPRHNLTHHHDSRTRQARHHRENANSGNVHSLSSAAAGFRKAAADARRRAEGQQATKSSGGGVRGLLGATAEFQKASANARQRAEKQPSKKRKKPG